MVRWGQEVRVTVHTNVLVQNTLKKAKSNNINFKSTQATGAHSWLQTDEPNHTTHSPALTSTCTPIFWGGGYVDHTGTTGGGNRGGWVIDPTPGAGGGPCERR